MELTTNSLRALLAHADRADVAAACGVDRTTVSRWANGRLTPHVRYLPNIARALGVRFEVTPDPSGPNGCQVSFRRASLEVERHETLRTPN